MGGEGGRGWGQGVFLWNDQKYLNSSVILLKVGLSHPDIIPKSKSLFKNGSRFLEIHWRRKIPFIHIGSTNYS